MSRKPPCDSSLTRCATLRWAVNPRAGGAPEARWTAPEVRWTAPEARWTAPEVRWTAPEARWTAPEGRWTAPEVRWTAPEARWTAPEVRWTAPEARWTAPEARRKVAWGKPRSAATRLPPGSYAKRGCALEARWTSATRRAS